MKFEKLYRDVYSSLALDGENHDIYFDDISKAINDAIRQRRIEHLQNEIGYDLADTETLSSFSQSTQYPFLQEDTLTNDILDDLPIEFTVLSSTAYTTDNELLDQIQSFSEGDLARKDGKLYECVRSFSSENTYNSVFDQRNYRNYYRSNGLQYDVGDVVYDKESDNYYQVNTGFTATENKDADNITQLDKLYWKKVDDSDIFVSHYPFQNLQELRVFDSLDRVAGIAIKGNKVYATSNINLLTLTYVSKWQEVNSFDDDVNIPDFLVPAVKNDAIRKLAQKLNIEVQLERQELEMGEEDGE